MESATLTVSPQYQITIPKQLREELAIEPGQKLLAWIEKWVKSKAITLVPQPKSLANYTLGLGKEIWDKVDIDKYIQKERDSWEK